MFRLRAWMWNVCHSVLLCTEEPLLVLEACDFNVVRLKSKNKYVTMAACARCTVFLARRQQLQKHFSTSLWQAVWATSDEKINAAK